MGTAEKNGRITVSDLAPVLALFHEVAHLISYQKTGEWRASAVNPELRPDSDPSEHEIHKRASEDYFQFRCHWLAKSLETTRAD